MIGEIWMDLNTDIIVNGFQKTGIGPFSMEVEAKTVINYNNITINDFIRLIYN